ncbi:MAG TPA: hypothetical protein VFA25_07305 [Actinomycetota bacterium]|jgi:hypothetical protein|nr:hypothetical protein [Actinomycetota bacterium]
MATSQLQVARDPALALVVRIFVGAVAERWAVDEPIRDDLRLAASELFSGWVEAGQDSTVVFSMTSDDGEVTLLADGLGTAPSSDADAWGGRIDLIRALFPQADVGDEVRISVPRS